MSYLIYKPFNQPGLQRLAGADLRTRTLNNFKEVLRQRQEIESRVEALKLSLEHASQHYDEIADRGANLDSSNRT